MDKTNTLLASLNYFSVFFAPFLLPIAIYFIVDHSEVKKHAKQALISHIIPFITMLIVIGLVVYSGFLSQNEGIFLTVFFSGVVIVVIINMIIFIWNIVKGIKLLMTI